MFEWRRNGDWHELFCDDKQVGCVRQGKQRADWFVAYYGVGTVSRGSEMEAKNTLERWVIKEHDKRVQEASHE